MEKVSTARIALKWGLIFGLLGIVTTTVIYTLNLLSQQWISSVVSIVLIFAILYFAFKEFRDLNGGWMRFGEGVGLGILLFVTSGVIIGIYDMLYKRFIDPTVIDKLVSITEQQYESMGMSPEMIEQSMESVRVTMEGPLAFVILVLTYAFMGLICSLIMAAIMKKTPPVFE